MKIKIIGICLLSLVPVGATTLTVEPAPVNAAIGQTFDLTVNISDVSDLFAFQFDLGFDPSVVAATGVSEGAFLGTGGSTAFVPGTIDNVGGVISDTADALIGPGPGVSGGGVLATLEFQAIGPGTSPITLSNVLLLDSNFNDISFTSSNGSVVSGASTVPEPRSLSLLLCASLIMASQTVKRRRLGTTSLVSETKEP